jgi:hypothetical protein
MNKYLTVKEYVELLEYINKNHSFREQKGRCAKYITSHFDTRTNIIYAIEFKGLFPELYKSFSNTNIHGNKTFKQLIYEWLEQKEELDYE